MNIDETAMASKETDEKSYVVRDLKYIMKSIVRRWWIFVLVGLIAGTCGVWYAYSKMPQYTSRLTFALDDANGSGMGNILNLASQFGFTIGASKNIFEGDNILEILKSRRMLDRVLLSIDTFNNKPYTLIEYLIQVTEMRKTTPELSKIHFPLYQSRPSFSYRQDSFLYVIGKKFAERNIVAERPDRKLGIYEVSVTSPDEKFTKIFTDRIVAETNNFYVEIRTKKAKETLDILEQRVAAMKENLNSSIQKRATVQDVNINPAFSTAEVPVLKQQSNIQTYGTAYGEMFKNLELARFQYLNEIPLMQIIDNADYPMQKEKMSKLKTGILFALLAELLVLAFFGIRSILTKQPH